MKKINWAVRAFNEWKTARNAKTIKHPELNLSVIIVELLEMSKDELCHVLSRFILEVKKKDGTDYPCESIYDLIIAIQMYLHTNGKEYKLLNDKEFVSLTNVVNAKMCQLSKEGKRVQRRQAEAITYEEEDKMWQDGILGDQSPKQLVDTVLYSFGIHFALRAGSEHKSLRVGELSQFKIIIDNGKKILRYQEHASKAQAGGLRHRKIVPKCVDAFENLTNPERCVVRLYEKYTAHRPAIQKCKDTSFYLQPIDKPVNEIWYKVTPIGINTLCKTVKRLCQSAGIEGHKTNHSLRATAASRLYNSNVEEQLICETTGHRSTAVRSYKRTSNDQKNYVSDLLYSKKHIVDKEYQVSASNPGTSKEDDVVISSPNKVKDSLNITINVNINK